MRQRWTCELIYSLWALLAAVTMRTLRQSLEEQSSHLPLMDSWPGGQLAICAHSFQSKTRFEGHTGKERLERSRCVSGMHANMHG